MIDGHKWFSSGAEGAGFGIVMAVTDPDAPPHARATQIIVPADTPGVDVVRPVPVLGHAGRGWSTHCEVRYTGVRVPVANTLGEVGQGFAIAQKRLGPGRIHHVMRWLGQMQRAFDLLCSYALERETFGGPLAEKQTVQNWIADSYAEIQACRLMTLDAAHKIDGGDEARVEISRSSSTRRGVLHDVIDRAVQVHGARGLTDETPLAQHAAAGACRTHLRRAGRGASDGRRAACPEELPARRRLAVHVIAESLKGSLLVSSPALHDPNFRRTVVLIAHHDDDGAMGLVLTRPSDVPASEAVPSLEGFPGADGPVYVGGPVQPEAFMVLAEFADPDEAAVPIIGGVGFMSAEAEPDELSIRRLRLFAGYAGWGAGQLEAELAEPSWIVIPARRATRSPTTRTSSGATF